MAHSTHTRPGSPRRPRRLITWLAMGALAAAAAAALAGAPTARADGDPASDVLTAQPLFVPQDSGLSVGQQTQLAGLVSAAGRTGYPVRVAVIASPSDLGSVTELWRQPGQYARFLDQELSLVYRGTLLVIMPDGYGLAGAGSARPALRAALPQAPPGPGGRALGRATLTSVRALAAAAGHPLPAVAATTRRTPRSSSRWPLVVLICGAALMLVAWGASLRIGPVRAPPASS